LTQILYLPPSKTEKTFKNQKLYMENLIYVLPLFGVIALVYMAILSSWVTKQDAGDAKMTGIAKNIADGAMAFLKAEYRILAIYVVLASTALGILSQVPKVAVHSKHINCGCFVYRLFLFSPCRLFGNANSYQS
jgi:hypothetical protein